MPESNPDPSVSSSDAAASSNSVGATVPTPLHPDSSPKTQLELELDAAKNRVAFLEEKVAQEAALSAKYGDGIRRFASYLHGSFCECCRPGGSRNLCNVFLAASRGSADWTEASHQYWLKMAAKVISDLPSLGWTFV